MRRLQIGCRLSKSTSRKDTILPRKRHIGFDLPHLMPYSYIIAPNGEMWFTENIYFGRPFSSSQYLNLPVPFKVGDIITIDCTPFAPVKHAVITEVKNINYRSGVVCAYVADNGKVGYSFLKDPMFWGGIIAWVSPLYRAEIFTDELPEEEKLLKEIADKLCT